MCVPPAPRLVGIETNPGPVSLPFQRRDRPFVARRLVPRPIPGMPGKVCIGRGCFYVDPNTFVPLASLMAARVVTSSAAPYIPDILAVGAGFSDRYGDIPTHEFGTIPTVDNPAVQEAHPSMLNVRFSNRFGMAYPGGVRTDETYSDTLPVAATTCAFNGHFGTFRAASSPNCGLPFPMNVIFSEVEAMHMGTTNSRHLEVYFSTLLPFVKKLDDARTWFTHLRDNPASFRIISSPWTGLKIGREIIEAVMLEQFLAHPPPNAGAVAIVPNGRAYAGPRCTVIHESSHIMFDQQLISLAATGKILFLNGVRWSMEELHAVTFAVTQRGVGAGFGGNTGRPHLQFGAPPNVQNYAVKATFVDTPGYAPPMPVNGGGPIGTDAWIEQQGSIYIIVSDALWGSIDRQTVWSGGAQALPWVYPGGIAPAGGAVAPLAVRPPYNGVPMVNGAIPPIANDYGAAVLSFPDDPLLHSSRVLINALELVMSATGDYEGGLLGFNLALLQQSRHYARGSVRTFQASVLAGMPDQYHANVHAPDPLDQDRTYNTLWIDPFHQPGMGYINRPSTAHTPILSLDARMRAHQIQAGPSKPSTRVAVLAAANEAADAVQLLNSGQPGADAVAGYPHRTFGDLKAIDYGGKRSFWVAGKSPAVAPVPGAGGPQAGALPADAPGGAPAAVGQPIHPPPPVTGAAEAVRLDLGNDSCYIDMQHINSMSCMAAFRGFAQLTAELRHRIIIEFDAAITHAAGLIRLGLNLRREHMNWLATRGTVLGQVINPPVLGLQDGIAQTVCISNPAAVVAPTSTFTVRTLAALYGIRLPEDIVEAAGVSEASLLAGGVHNLWLNPAPGDRPTEVWGQVHTAMQAALLHYIPDYVGLSLNHVGFKLQDMLFSTVAPPNNQDNNAQLRASFFSTRSMFQDDGPMLSGEHNAAGEETVVDGKFDSRLGDFHEIHAYHTMGLALLAQSGVIEVPAGGAAGGELYADIQPGAANLRSPVTGLVLDNTVRFLGNRGAYSMTAPFTPLANFLPNEYTLSTYNPVTDEVRGFGKQFQFANRVQVARLERCLPQGYGGNGRAPMVLTLSNGPAMAGLGANRPVPARRARGPIAAETQRLKATAFATVLTEVVRTTVLEASDGQGGPREAVLTGGTFALRTPGQLRAQPVNGVPFHELSINY